MTYYSRELGLRVPNALVSGLKDILIMDSYKVLIFQLRIKKYGFKLREQEKFSER